MRTKLLVAAIVVLALAAAGLLLFAPAQHVSSASPADATAASAEAAHRAHLPPTRGSDLYQYDHPGRRHFDASQVYSPVPPPPGPAPNGVREYTLTIREDAEHEVAPGIKVPAWAFNGTVPGPVLRATEGDTLRITVINHGSLPHTIHFHGSHPAKMDGVFELIPPGGQFVYEFVAQPYGIMPYHCHAMPTSQHIHNGLYGMLIIDPKGGRKPMRELAMVMSAFDLDRDGEAEFYAWNGRAFQYADNPIELRRGEPVRMYVLNMFEESMVPHMHGTLYHLYPSGTTVTPTEYTDVKTLNIAERAMLEFRYDFPGDFMFQCHVTEHMEQGLMGWFHVTDDKTEAAAHTQHRQ